MVTVSQRQSIVIEAHGSDPSHTEVRQREEGALHPSPEQLPLDVLLQEAHQEISRFRGKQETTNVASFEVFRRALLLRDDAAWAGLYQLYAPLIETWILLRRPGGRLHADELAAMVNEALAKFALALPAERWPRFAGTDHLLAYLKRCALTVAAEAWRLQQRWAAREASLERLDHEQSPLLDDPAEAVTRQLVLHELWQVAAGIARCEQERLLLQQHYAQGVPLQELPARYPELFPTIQSVYSLKRNLLQRLRRSRAVQEAVGLGQTPAHRPTKRSPKRRETSQKGTPP